MKTISKAKEAEYDALISEDVALWETGKLGADAAHAMPVESLRKKASITTTIRLSEQMLDQLKRRAEREGMPYQTLVKHVLTKYLRAG